MTTTTTEGSPAVNHAALDEIISEGRDGFRALSAHLDTCATCSAFNWEGETHKAVRRFERRHGRLPPLSEWPSPRPSCAELDGLSAARRESWQRATDAVAALGFKSVTAYERSRRDAR